MEEFQKSVQSGIDFLKEKITTPGTGLDARVINLEDVILKKDEGLEDRVKVLEAVVKNPSKVQALGTSSGTTTGTIQDSTVTQLNHRLSDVENKLATNDFQTKMLLCWADNMYKDHKSLHKKVLFHEAKHRSNELIIGGIQENSEVQPKKASATFLESKLGIKAAQNDLFSARRIGKNRVIQVESTDENGAIQIRRVTCPRHMIIKCSTQLKNRILGKKRSLAGKVDPQGYKYFIAPYLPPPFQAAQVKHKAELKRIYTSNAKKNSEDKTPANVVGTDLYVNKKVVMSLIQPPTPGEVCAHRLKFAKEMDSFELASTRPLVKDGSVFQGFAVRLSQLMGVSIAYSKVRITAPRARHIMCAFKVSNLSDSCDDGEDHAGMLIAKMLQKANRSNVAVFVTRETGPDQLGEARFEYIRQMVNESLQMLDNLPSTTPVDARWFTGPAPPASLPSTGATPVASTAATSRSTSDEPTIRAQLQRTAIDDWSQPDEWASADEGTNRDAWAETDTDETESKMIF